MAARLALPPDGYLGMPADLMQHWPANDPTSARTDESRKIMEFGLRAATAELKCTAQTFRPYRARRDPDRPAQKIYIDAELSAARHHRVVIRGQAQGLRRSCPTSPGNGIDDPDQSF